MSNEEEGIARVQAEAIKAKGTQGAELQAHQNRGIAAINDRIVVFILVLAVMGLFVLWFTSSSPLLLYGSLIAVIALLVLWGLMRIKRIDRLREERAAQARNWESGRD